jgi:gluconolactonase
MKKLFPVAILALCAACSTPEKQNSWLERYDESLDGIISANAKADTIATGLDWSEGPVWVPAINKLLFSDVPQNVIYSWSESEGKMVYLTPSGYTGTIPRGGEPGSNGLMINSLGELVLCQHGDRKIAVMKSGPAVPQALFSSLADHYRGMKFNSPNDITQDKKGNYYFTDPPYGLINNVNDSTKETPFQGVYKIASNGKLYLLVDSLTRPNGIAFSPDEKFLFVANSDSVKARWYRYEVGDSTLSNGTVFYDATNLTAKMRGLPDGMKINKQGTIFATGPGGVFIFNDQGKLLGKIKSDNPTSNCAFADDEKTLYVTADMNVVRIRLKD